MMVNAVAIDTLMRLSISARPPTSFIPSGSRCGKSPLASINSRCAREACVCCVCVYVWHVVVCTSSQICISHARCRDAYIGEGDWSIGEHTHARASIKTIYVYYVIIKCSRAKSSGCIGGGYVDVHMIIYVCKKESMYACHTLQNISKTPIHKWSTPRGTLQWNSRAQLFKLNATTIKPFMKVLMGG